jgi:Dyp-type peroxidase family
MSYLASDTQGNIVRGYRHLHNVCYVFCEVRDARPTRALLRELLPNSSEGDIHDQLHVRTDEQWKATADIQVAVNIAFTFSGLQELGWGSEFERFEDFAQGMYARAVEHLGDGDRSEWGPAGLYEGAHILFTIYFDDDPISSDRVAWLRERFRRGGLAEIAVQRARAIRRPKERFAREHFGFRDGFSQPILQGVYPSSHPRRVVGEGVLDPPRPSWESPHWRGLRLGEILLGHKDEDGVVAGDKERVLKNGTFMVWRKIEQDVDAFKTFFERVAPRVQDQELLKAKVVGRWPDGTSVLEPHDPDGARPPSSRPRNDFDYGDDPDGAGCPLGAHVRRANPRTSLKWWTLRTVRHRIIRRGMPYEESDGAQNRRVGLVFVCFNASIARQFEMIQRFWLSDGDAFGLGGDSDFMLGSHGERAKMVVNGDRRNPPILLDLAGKRFVTVRGGYYLFVPGISALRLIARGPAPTKRWWHRLGCE